MFGQTWKKNLNHNDKCFFLIRWICLMSKGGIMITKMINSEVIFFNNVNVWTDASKFYSQNNYFDKMWTIRLCFFTITHQL